MDCIGSMTLTTSTGVTPLHVALPWISLH